MSTSCVRYTASNPCPVCGSGTKGCSVLTDGFQRCRGEPSAGWVQLSDNGTFRGYRHENDLERNSWRKAFDWPDKPKRGNKAGGKSSNQTATNQTTSAKSGDPKEKPPGYWPSLAAQYAANLTADPDLREELARLLRFPATALDHIPNIGYIPGKAILLDGEPTNDGQWTFPETDAAGTVIGIARRWRPYCGGPDGDKRSITGSGRGLTIPTDFHTRYPSGPILVVEGQTDTIALAMIGVAAVGRPGNKLGGELLAQFLRGVPKDRPIVVMGENDRKPTGLWPGREGAESIARHIANHPDHAGRTVFIAYPPESYKDAREWISATFDADGVCGAYDTVRRIVIDHVYDAARPYGTIHALGTNQTTSNETGQSKEGVRNESIDGNDSTDYIRSYCCGVSCSVACGCESRSTGPRASSSIARRNALEQLARDDVRQTTPKPSATLTALPPDLIDVIGKPPRFRPCRHPRYRPREGCHPSTAGTFDILRTTCGKCGPCQEKIRHAEKLLHCSAAYASATHVWHGDEEDYQALEAKLFRLRKKLGVKKPFGYSRPIQDGETGRRVSFFAIPADLDIPGDTLADMGLSPITGIDAAAKMSRAIDNIPYRMPKFTKRILTNKTWRDASLIPPPEEKPREEEKLYADLEPQPLQGPDLVWAQQAAEDKGSVVTDAPIANYRIEGRIIVRPKPDTEDEVFRELFGRSLTQVRMAAERKREEAREKREAREESRREWRWLGSEAKRLRKEWMGRESEAPGFIGEWLLNW